MSTPRTVRQLLDDAIKWLMDAKDAERNGRVDEWRTCAGLAKRQIDAAFVLADGQE